MDNQSDSTIQLDGAALSDRREILKAGLALVTLPILAATSAGAQVAETQTTMEATMNDAESKAFIDNMAEMMSHSSRSPILRRPDEYGMAYEDAFFPSLDGVPLEGWFIPADSDRLVIANHPMPCNRYGFPGHLKQWSFFGGFEVNFLPQYKALHDAGYNVLAYDLRNHGRSGMGSGGVNGHGTIEYRDVVGSLRYAKTLVGSQDMKTVLLSRCLGANASIVGMKRHPNEFSHVKSMIAVQPVSPKVFVEKAVENEGIKDGVARFSTAFHDLTGQKLDETWSIEDSRAVIVPTLVTQVHNDFRTKPSNVQQIFDLISAADKKLFWIEGTDERFQGYNHFNEHPEMMLAWFDSHM
jgi:pimeloyl-ACP methyl ester carboxylesterase